MSSILGAVDRRSNRYIYCVTIFGRRKAKLRDDTQIYLHSTIAVTKKKKTRTT